MAIENSTNGARSPVLAHAQLLCRLHGLIAEGKGDRDEADAVRDAMDTSWFAMSSTEQDRMGGLSEDLYALHEGGPKRSEMNPEKFAHWQQHAKDVLNQLDSGNVDSVLCFLRQPVPSQVSARWILSLQARCWEKLGDLRTALVFKNEVERLDPDHAQSEFDPHEFVPA